MKKEYETIGRVYVVEDADRGLCKIGMTCVKNNPFYNRAKAVRKASGVVSGCVWTSPLVKNAVQLEHDIHTFYKDSRVSGEWFAVPYKTVVAALKSRLDLADDDYIKEKKAIAEERAKAFTSFMGDILFGADGIRSVVNHKHDQRAPIAGDKKPNGLEEAEQIIRFIGLTGVEVVPLEIGSCTTFSRS